MSFLNYLDPLDVVIFVAMVIALLVQGPWKPKNVLKRLGAELGLTGKGPATPFGPALIGQFRGVNTQLEICPSEQGGKGLRFTLQARCPVPRGLRLSRGTLSAGHRGGLPDLEIGIAGVDRALVIQGEDEQGVRALLGAPELREALMRFVARHPGGRIEGDRIVYQQDVLPSGSEDLRELLDEGVAVVNALEAAAGGRGDAPWHSPEEVESERSRRAEHRRIVTRARWRRAGSILLGSMVMSSGFVLIALGRIPERHTELAIGVGLLLGAAVTIVSFRCPSCGSRVMAGTQLLPEVCDNCGVALR